MFRPRVVVALAVAGALGFVLLRLLYRVIFGGAGRGSTVLWSLDAVSLPGPFSHVVVGGTVTLEGLQAATWSAVPFALVILVTGSLAAFFDPRRILFAVSPSTRGSSVPVALGIALATLPFLVREAQAVRQALALRGVRRGFRLVIPLIEKTLERAMGLAKTLESRGMWGATYQPTELNRGALLLENITIPSRGLGPITWEIPAGSNVVLTGATGSGKTSVLELLAGVLNVRGDAPFVGRVVVPARRVAYMPHDPSVIFLTSRVVDDVALSLGTGTASGEETIDKALHVLERCGLLGLAYRSPDTLSSGEQVLAALQVLLASHPDVLVLDEPLSSLSDESTQLFLEQVSGYAATTGATVVMTDHPKRDNQLEGCEYWQLRGGQVSAGRYESSAFEKNFEPFVPAEPDGVLLVTDLTIERDGEMILSSANLDVGRGELVAVLGDNGAGKTTLLEAIALAESSSIQVTGEYLQDVRLVDRPRRVALVPSLPTDLFVCSSVAEELAFADQVAGVEAGFSEATLWSLLTTTDETLRDKVLRSHPRDLSRGQQTALAVSLQLSLKPAVVLMDEPFRGLDETAEAVMAEVIECVLETGTAVVVATHYRDHLPLRWDRTVVLEHGVLHRAGTGA